MLNPQFRRLCVPLVNSVKSISAIGTIPTTSKGWSGWQMTGSVRHFRNQPIIIPKPKKVYHPAYEYQETIEDTTAEDEAVTKEVISKVNSQIASQSHGRLFAVIYLQKKQYRVTKDDLIVAEGDWAPLPKDSIRFEKVIMVGSTDFTLLGRPLLMPDLVRVTGTVVDKRLEATRYYFFYIPRRQRKTSYFNRAHMTIIRINSVEITNLLDEQKEVEGLEGRVL